ncbi:glycoside hydrolase family 3 protein [Zasmidium cellare ATCC 36951]|uniref:beta-glucosidase n=1 Tax=Zasmidium cellare ATCC 36951 TaxID=1080233 RepID=A0A6A6CWS6_ZASCE|nr:glycoside hydrolase family 3 protein [Zasmidium cellare ATCC 36951]KAF2170658.1 glycoside hydrolase family 3 protein [Zasmidium cellare ATCC 36951]
MNFLRLEGDAALVSHSNKTAFIESLVSQMTVPEMALQLYLFFADDAVGPNSTNELYDHALQLAPSAGIGIIHDWYTLNKTQVNSLTALNLEKSRLKIPFLHLAECLHGVGSFKQSMFPQSIGLAATWDVDLVHRVARAIAKEARSIGIHACLSPVLDVCKDSRWGRCQEDWGEDHILTSHLGVAYASGLSKNSSWGEPDAVVPVMKHFAAHGAPQGGLNAAPWMGHGNREVLQNLLTPFKAAVELGGARGVLMAYSELDDVPSHVNPMLYGALEDWEYDGFVIADDTGMSELEEVHRVASSPADAIGQWYNAGGMISYYDYPLETFLNSTVDLVKNHTVSLSTLKQKMRRILGVKYDLGLFSNPYIPDDTDPEAIVEDHIPLTLEAAHKSIVLMENRNSTLPLKANSKEKIALVGPYSDILNYGDYAGQFGQYPVAHSSTLREGILNSLKATNSNIELVTAWGANTWLHNAQYPIAGYHLSTPNGTTGGLQATYFAGPNFTEPLVNKTEVPVRDWGLYPPPGLPSNNFSAVWEGTLHVPVDIETQGWLGVGISWNATANLYIDDALHVHVPLTTTGNLLSNIPGRAYTLVNSTLPPPGSEPFTFKPSATHKLRLEFQSWNLYQKIANQNSLNAEVLLFWNLVSPSSSSSSNSTNTTTSALSQALQLASTADKIILPLGANWNSDGESGDRATMGLSPNQTALAHYILSLNKPTILLLSGGRPFALPELYNHTSTAAVLSTWFGGQSAGQAVADVLFGTFNPGGRLPLSVPRDVGQMPIFYNYKPTTHQAAYVDLDPSPAYPFGYGLSYSNFTLGNFTASSGNGSFTPSTPLLSFTLRLTNTSPTPGSYTPQIYLLGRVSSITQPVKQLVAFQRVYLEGGESRQITLEVDVDRYLKILNRVNEWVVEGGEYTFAMLEDGGMWADTGRNVSLRCV